MDQVHDQLVCLCTTHWQTTGVRHLPAAGNVFHQGDRTQGEATPIAQSRCFTVERRLYRSDLESYGNLYKNKIKRFEPRESSRNFSCCNFISIDMQSGYRANSANLLHYISTRKVSFSSLQFLFCIYL